jgi:hypothetical protein
MYIWNWGQRLKSVSTANRHIQAEHFFAEGDPLLVPQSVFSTLMPPIPAVLGWDSSIAEP